MHDFLIKSEEVSDPEYGKYPGARSVEELSQKGIIILDKPSGPTSHQVTAWVKDIFDLDKAGHSGTLDPKVTGVLVITLGKACKIMPALMGLDKTYVAIMELHDNIGNKDLKEVLEKFTGKIKQLPPKKSAVKRRRRTREVHEIKMLGKEGRKVLLEIKCQKGTYIRKLIHDIGKKLVCGAHMRELRRTQVGGFSEKNATNLQEIKDSYVLWEEKGDEKIRDYLKPVEFGIEHIKKIVVKDSTVDALTNGAPLGVGGISRVEDDIEKDDMVVFLTEKGELVALGYSKMNSSEIIKSRSGIAAMTDRVIMERGEYPKMWGKKQI